MKPSPDNTCSDPAPENAQVSMPSAYRWQAVSGQGWRGHVRGPGAHRLAAKLAAAAGPDEMVAAINEHPDFSGGIVQKYGTLLAWADHIRSFPLFYAVKDGRLFLSPDARAVRDAAGLKTSDDLSALEFALAGYATGKHTLYEGLSALQPGEFLLWDGKNLMTRRYFRYVPSYTEGDSAARRAQMGAIMDSITQKIINRASGRTIFIPLSGGLDSRLILAKLHEHGYKNIRTFSYGPKYNFEAGRARKIAARLGVEWRFIAPPDEWLRVLFESPERKAFWRFADGLKTVPCMRECGAFMWMKTQKMLPADAIIINGQSGDYITGNHINRRWLGGGQAAEAELHAVLAAKHFDLWRGIGVSPVFSRLPEIVPDVPPAGDSALYAAAEETWEYDARQVVHVVNGQRIYDFLGLEWELPLWERELVEFCRTLSLPEKAGQTLYREWLKRWNYRGLFPEKEKYIWRWPMPKLWIVPAARVIGLLRGAAAKQRFYAMHRYDGHYANQYAFFPREEHEATAMRARNVTSLFVRRWIQENPDLFSSAIKAAVSA